MQYRIDPRTGNKLSPLEFGCMRLPRGNVDMEEKSKLEEVTLKHEEKYDKL